MPGSLRHPDLLVVGGGLIGLSCAWRCAQGGLRVEVLDSGAPGAASWAAAGMLAPAFEHGEAGAGEHPDLHAFGVKSLQAWPEFAAELEAVSGVSLDFRRDGGMMVSYEADALERFLKEAGEGAEALDRKAAHALEPALGPEVTAALYSPQDAQVDPRRVVEALRIALRKAGGVLREGVRAQRIEDGEAVLEDGARRAAHTLLIATGARLRALGLPDAPPVRPVKGQLLSRAMTGLAPRAVVRAPGAYLCPKAGGRLVIGATEEAGTDDLEIHATAIAELTRAGARAIPAITEYVQTDAWAGLRPGTPDHAPFLGLSARTGARLVYAVGHHRNGVLQTPETARVISALILKGARDPALAAFRPDRFDV